MKFDEVGTTLKHLETINGNVKNLSKVTFSLSFIFYPFTFENLTLPFNIIDFIVTGTRLVNFFKNISV